MSVDVAELEREANVLPDGWCSHRLGDVATLSGGTTPSRAEAAYWENATIPWATPSDITSLPVGVSRIADTETKVSDRALAECSLSLNPPGTVLMTSRATIGFVAVNDVPMATNQGFITFRAGDRLDAGFLLYWLTFQRGNLVAAAGGSTFKELGRGTAKLLPILLPPLDEQRRIAEVLRSVDEAIAAADAVLACARSARSAVLDDLLKRADGNWQTVPFSEAADINPKRVLPKVGSVPFLDMANLPLNGASVNVTHLRPISSGGARFKGGDTLFARITPCAENGKLGYVEAVMGGDVAQGSTEFIVMAGRKGVTTSQYVRCLAGWDELRQQAIGLMEGTSGRQRIPSWAFDMIDVPLPPLERQEQITAVMQAMDSMVLECQGSLQQQQAFKAGLMSDLISGRVRVPA